MSKNNIITISMAIALLICSVASIFIGAIDLRSFELENFGSLDLILLSRLPRLLAILCTGVGMSVSGLIMQQLCMNKFVSPTTGATISSAQFGVLLSLVFFTNTTLFQKTMLAFVTSIIGTWIFVWMIQQIKFKDVMLVPLIGIMFGMVINGFTNFFAYRYGAMQSLSATLVGDFSLIIKGRYEIVFLVVPLVIIAFIYANHFNIVGMGEDFANNLGISYNTILLIGLSIAALITASVVVTVGTISYIGLIVPNIVSMFRGDKIRGSLLDVALFGALFVLVCDMIGRLLIHPYELPVDLIAGVIGSLVFIFFMNMRLSTGKKRKKQIQKTEVTCCESK
ncbi:MAG: iron chelate uptake ABC transporter family permease subunit [Eubacteriales bacterium]